MKSTPSPARIAAFALALVALGFFLGIGFQTLQYANLQKGDGQNSTSSSGNSVGEATKKKPPPAPLVRGLRVSKNDRLLAFNALYGASAGQSQQAGRFVFDLQTYHWNEAKSPDGWQDSITQWNSEGSQLLFAREKIPRASSEGEP